MKNYFFIILLFLYAISQAQIGFISGIEGAGNLIINGDYIYVAQDNIGPVNSNNDKISKIDITSNPPIVTEVATGLNKLSGLVFNGNDLYFSEIGDNSFGGGKLSKIDITDPELIVNEVLSGLYNPYGLVINGNDLYLAEFQKSRIIKIDITESFPTISEVIAGIRPFGLVVNGNDMYISQWIIGEPKISKIDITLETPTISDVISTEGLFPFGLTLKDNNLFMVGYDQQVSRNRLFRFDITSSSPIIIVKDLTSIGIFGPRGFVINGNDAYISERGPQRISKFDFDLLLSTDNISLKDEFKIYPNPVKNVLNLSSELPIELIKIYSLQGQLIQVTSENQIDVSLLSSGLYFVSIIVDGENIVKKFIKN